MADIKNILELKSLTQMVEARFKELSPELTLPQYIVMSAVQSEVLSQRQITAATGVDRSTLSAIIRLLDDKGYLSINSSKADLRVTLIGLSAKGKQVFKAASKDAMKVDRELSRIMYNE